MTIWNGLGFAPGLLAFLLAAAVLQLGAQSPPPAQSQAKPKFEVASIKACDPKIPRGTNAGTVSPGRVDYNCARLWDYIFHAYAIFANGPIDIGGRLTKIEGPAWINTELFEIHAKAQGNPGPIMQGPMMQALLEDRFKLRLHRETREIPVYALVVVKTGLRLPAAKVNCILMGPEYRRLMQEYMQRQGKAKLVTADFDALPPRCGEGKLNLDGLQMHGATMDDFCLAVSSRFPLRLDHRVIDKTGVAGHFDFDLTWAPEERIQSPPDAPNGAAAHDPADDFTRLQGALRKFGLQLVPAKGPGEFLVIDHVERPSAN
jgi:uncharacterized protein (TIGR03435 family)